MKFRDPNHKKFTKAQRDAEASGSMVCGTLAEDGTPIYFLMDRDATDAEVRKRAFELRHGRPMDNFEEQFLDLAETLRRPR